MIVADPVLSFIDLETGGLDETRHAVLEVAIVRTTPLGEHLSATVFPLRAVAGRVVEVEAFRLHGLAGLEGLDPGEAYEAAASQLAGTILAGYNLQFDKRFLRALCLDVGGEPLTYPPSSGRHVLFDHHELDVAAAVMPLWLLGVVPSCSLAKAAEALGCKVWGPAHRALNDCLTTVEVYREILRRHCGRPVGT